ncbi:hypothetical protein Dtox_3380 [Desulfofarcimen acetoxidans DSM 771]|uniref:Uncharacterized protein n=1 Tax=Desulfofarcimen acetoxidans (strain ATCC 49208 / DSM 771 / KCTC 5769 / VKM B-1644 / 5575) TaxID=485916 RepID=C8W6K1_DESAS|nr:hypothetical protein [Desulfofarcimen acetoxidans]ACV64110.1 hypothetical protein Dtox_3380 [Desulfofarcimen acetoxidans DSM 771]
MNDKVKGGLLIFFMSVTFYMMLTTKYTHALGDYMLEFIGLKSWTGDYSGIHLTVIYFGVLFILSLFLVEKYAIKRFNIRGRSVFFISVVLMIVFSSITGVTVKHVKSNSAGLLSIGYNSSDSSINYRSEDNKLVEFTAKFKLTNYSNEKKTFYLCINNPFDREKRIEEISFYTFDGKRAIFQLEGNETKSFSLSLDRYDVVGGRELQNVSGRGVVQEIVLTDDKSNKVRLDSKNFFGVEISR